MWIKNIVSTSIIYFFAAPIVGQKMSQSAIQKGSFYAYWGWNRGWFSNTDIRFNGNDYDFVIKNVVAKDRQSPFSVEQYFKPNEITIPQYDFRVGYFFTNKYSISFGIDHMKYVMQQNQIVKINGNIHTGSSYDGDYSNKDIQLKEDFLKFEHTDGLNYLNIELRRQDEILTFRKLKLHSVTGVGTGLLMPRTNTTLLLNDRYDQFHFAGYGFAGLGGINITFLNTFFAQTECKGGFINMPDIRTTIHKSDHASEKFFFAQWNLVFGVHIHLADIQKLRPKKGID